MIPRKMTILRPPNLTRLIVPLAIVVLAGCAVGPNFKKPDAPEVDGYAQKPLVNPQGAVGAQGGKLQEFVSGADIPAQWWTLFHSKALNSLVESSIKANPNIKAAQDALLLARENKSAQLGAFWPQISGGYAATRAKSSIQISPVTNTPALYYNLFTPQLDVSFVPDVFGLNWRNVESLKAQAEMQRFALEMTYITLTANVVTAAIQEGSLRAQVRATQREIDESKRMLAILKKQLAVGYAAGLDVAAQEAQLAAVAATLPPLVKALAQQRDLVANLAGKFPSEPLVETFELSSLELPRDLPVSLPSKLVRQRPDVRQAEENVHSACALVGVAVANRLPSFNLTGNLGTDAVMWGSQFASGTSFWTLGAAVTQPIFQGGTLLHRERAAKAALKEAEDQYRATVLTAFQNVADTLHALEQDGPALKAAVDAEKAAKKSLDLTSHQFEYGYANFLALLAAEQAWDTATINLVQAEALRYSDTAALFQALGGGWWNRPEKTKDGEANPDRMQTL
jgi:NodT family efflux transporter outer membrane factor (OMF) lipoprotein